MTIKQALTWACIKLNKSDSPQLDAEVLLSFVIKKNKTELYTYPEKKITNNEIVKFKKLINKRTKNYPVAYLINSQEFFGNTFYIDERVLIPRPETEILIEQAVQLIKIYKLKTIADIGTGSGCIAITLKKIFPKLFIIASDISQAALQVAKTNALLQRTKIHFIKGDLLTPFQLNEIDLFIANLPYVSPKIYSRSKSIQAEPKNALFAKKQGLEYIERILKNSLSLKYQPKFILLEINPEQFTKIKKITSKLHWQIKPYRDLQKHIRTLKITLK
jgi:release factor glutamine methyltransferase